MRSNMLTKRFQGVLKKHMRFNLDLTKRSYFILRALIDKTELVRAIRNFNGDVSKEDTDSFIKDIIICNFCYGITPNEYFLFNLHSKNEEERRDFVGYEYKLLICKKLRPQSNATLLSNKTRCYSVFHEYFRRDLIEISSQEHYDLFRDFCSKHSKMIVKPVSGNEGKGIYILNVQDKDVKKEFDSIVNKGVCVIEELVEQSLSLGCFHPSSVNTVRVVTYNDGNNVRILWTLLRMGQGGSFIDNASAGGIIASIDAETGVVCSKGYSETKKCLYDCHPETNQKISGYAIPNWDELKSQVQEMATLIPDYHFVGWDLALTDKGWTMIEANSGPSFVGTQLCEQKGKWPLVEALGIMQRR